MTKPKGRHVKVRRGKGTARKVSELINAIARLIRAVSVLGPCGCPRPVVLAADLGDPSGCNRVGPHHYDTRGPSTSTVRRDSSGMPAKGARCLTWDCPRKPRGRGGHGKRVARCGPGPRSLGSTPGRCAKASKKDKGRMPARGLLGHGLEPGQRTPAPGGGGRAPAGPWEAGARGQGPQVLLRRSEDPPAGVGGRRRAVR